MNLKRLLSIFLLLFVFNLNSAFAEALDETVIKKIDSKSDSLDSIDSLDKSSDKLNVSDPNFKKNSDKITSNEDETNSKKLSEREAKNEDTKEINDNSSLSNKIFTTKEEQILINGNEKKQKIIHNKDDKHNDIQSEEKQTNKIKEDKIKDDKIKEEKIKEDKIKEDKINEDKIKDDLPSFGEWKKKVVEEEPNNQQNLATINSSNKRLFQNSNKGNKLRIRNYASSECGAKVINSNKEAQGAYKILSESQDEYMLNPCNSKIWFIIEMCEAIKLSTIEVANYELFSSTFRNFLIYGSGHYPTRDWQLIGNFTANDIKQVQTFSFSGEVEFRKFIKIEILSHHGSEHFCPFSLVRVFGTSMTDEFDEIDNNRIPSIEEGEMFLEVSKSSENRSETRNYLNEKSVFYKLLVKVAGFFYKTQPKGDSEKENLLDFLQDIDTVNAVIEQSAMNMMPTLEPKLNLCLNLDKQSKKQRNKKVKFCNYLRTLVSATTFDLLMEEMIKDNNTKFKCLFNSSSSEINLKNVNNSNNTKQTIDSAMKSDLESSIVNKKLESTVELGNEGISLNSGLFTFTNSIKVTSSNSQTVLLPTPTIVIKSDEEQPFSINNLDSSQSDDSSRNEEKSIEFEDKKSSNSQTDAVKNQLSSDEINKLNNKEPILKDNTAETDQIKSTEKTSSPLEGTITSSKTMHSADDELPTNGAPLSGSASKETIFIRMINKIKALELNLSLSSQYLEELSQRYRRQMDEMQKNFNQTIFKLNETSKSAAEKDNRQQLLLDELGSKILVLEEKLFILLAIIIAKVIFDLISWYRR